MSVQAALAEAARTLAPVSDTPRLDAELLLAHALGVERQGLLLDPEHYAVPARFAELLARRLAHEPIAYIVGYRDFWTIRLRVGPGVLIPRNDSEALIEAAVAYFGKDGPGTVLDLGTGPGTLLLAALAHWPAAVGMGIDASSTALGYAEDNAVRLGLAARARFALGDWSDGGAADLVLCNPPYVEADAKLDPQVRDHEPSEALFAGPEGLDAYRRIMPALVGRLTPGGLALIEIGATQAEAVCQLARAAGFAQPMVGQDLAGLDRYVSLIAH